MNRHRDDSVQKIAVRYDLDHAMRPCEGQLSMDGGVIRVGVTENGAFREDLSVSADEVLELCVYARVGSGLVYIKFKVREGEPERPEQILCRFTMGCIKEMGAFCKQVNYFFETGVLTGTDSEEKRACEKCGRPLMSGLNFCIFCIKKSAVLKRAAELMKPVAAPLIASGCILTLSQLLYVTIPMINRVLVDNHLKPQTGTLREVLFLVGLMFAARAAGEIINILNSRIFNRSSAVFANLLRNKAYEKVQSLSISSISKKTAGDLMRRIMSDTQKIMQFLCDQGRWAFEQVIVFFGVLVILLFTSPKLTLYVFLPVPFVMGFAAWFWPFINRRYDRQWRLFSRSNSVLHDIIKGIRVVKSFGNEEREIEKFGRTCKEHAEASASNEKLWSATFPLMGFIAGLGEYLVLYFGGKAVLGNVLTTGELIQFTMYIAYIYGPLRWIVSFPRWFADAMTSMVKVFEILDEKPEITDAEQTETADMSGGIRFENATFGYKPYEPVLKDLTLDIRPGEMIGLVGRSGVGKSTLINLVMRLYDVDAGSVCIGGVDLRRIPQKLLHENIGVVFQDTFLFAGSIYDNIAYAKTDASHEEIIAAAKVANAHEFIIKLPDTYNTVVGENGYSLSGGERQRLAIARAVLRDPPILILDEATSSLDVETEGKIQEALGRLVKGRTTIAIAHRLATLRNADRLVVLDKGQLAEVGTHAELLRRKGIYYNLVMAQRQTTKLAPAAGEVKAGS